MCCRVMDHDVDPLMLSIAHEEKLMFKDTTYYTKPNCLDRISTTSSEATSNAFGSFHQ